MKMKEIGPKDGGGGVPITPLGSANAHYAKKCVHLVRLRQVQIRLPTLALKRH